MLRIPVFTTVLSAYAFVWRERRDFLALAFPAIVALAILITLSARLAAAAGAAAGIGLGFGVLLLGVANLAVWVLFAVAWHRRFLLPDERATVRAALRWHRRHTRFLMLAIALFGLLALAGLLGGPLIMLVFGAVAGLGGALILALVLTLCYARLSLLFPAAAVDHGLSFRNCWEMTRGNGWRLLWIVFLVGIPIGAIEALIDGLIGGVFRSDSLTAPFLAALAGETLAFVGIGVGVSALSLAYRSLMNGHRAPPA